MFETDLVAKVVTIKTVTIVYLKNASYILTEFWIFLSCEGWAASRS